MALALGLCASGCAEEPKERARVGVASAAGRAAPSGLASAAAAPASLPPGAAPAPVGPLCPPEMVAIEGRTCVDRWEASLVDKATATPLSPYYPPSRKLAVDLYERWERERLAVGGARARQMPLPPLPLWQQKNEPEPMAVSRPGVVPNAYVSGHQAERACENAGKRLCTHEEWMTACMGEQKTQFPYGAAYEPGACNIFRSTHPSLVLHDDFSTGHLDPRLNLVTEPGGKPLLRRTGATETCVSRWGSGGLYDMNGNLDEWVADEKGRFVGGFYARSKKDGCRSSVSSHGKGYRDYSTGVRCCSSPTTQPTTQEGGGARE